MPRHRRRPDSCAASVTLAVAVTFVLGCHPGLETPGVPLYPNSATAPLPRNQLAQVSGPIAEVDGKDVQNQGGLFDLLPGCHVVVLDRRPPDSGYSLSGGMYWSGMFPNTVYVFHMKAGARYVIRRDIYSDDGHTGHLALSAREEMPGQPGNDLEPATSPAQIQACKPSTP